MTLKHRRLWPLSVCMCVPSYPLASSQPRPYEMFSYNVKLHRWMGCGPARWVWLALGSQGHNRKNKNRDPQAHDPCRGRGLDMVGHFWKRGGAASDGMFWISSTGLIITNAITIFFKLPILPGEHLFSAEITKWYYTCLCCCLCYSK